MDSGRYLYTVTTRAILTDVFASLTLKRRLEQGLETRPASDVVGRVSLADAETVAAATKAAAAAAPAWAATPLATRMRARRADQGPVAGQATPSWSTCSSPRAARVRSPGGRWPGCSSCSARRPSTTAPTQLHQERVVGPRTLTVRRVADGVVCVNPPQNAPAASALVRHHPAAVRQRGGRAGATQRAARRHVRVAGAGGAGAGRGRRAGRGAQLLLRAARPGAQRPGWTARTSTTSSTPATSSAASSWNASASRGARSRSWSWPATTAWWSGRTPTSTARSRRSPSASTAPARSAWCPTRWWCTRRSRTSCATGSPRAAAAIRPGYPDDPAVLLSPVLRSERFFAYVRDALDHGATLVHGARRLEVDGEVSDTGPFLEPTVLRVNGFAAAGRSTRCGSETFFPLLPVIVPETDRLDRRARTTSTATRTACGTRCGPPTTGDRRVRRPRHATAAC